MAAELSVYVNLTWLVPGVVGGSEESTTDSLRAILENRSDIKLRLGVLESFGRAHPDLADSIPTDVLDLSGASKVRRVLAEQTWLAGVVRDAKPNVVHHAGGVVPLIHPGVCTLTIHDIQPLDMPSNFSLAKRTYMKLMLKRSVNTAALICVPSEFTKQRVCDRLSAPEAKVRVVPWCVRPPGSDANESATAITKLAQSQYLLYPAITHPHKNHATLLRAFELLRRSNPDLLLVLPGGEGLAEADVSRLIQSSESPESVVRLGRLSPPELDALYSNAVGVVIPSTYEGFGLPALEAMQRGVALAVSDAGSLPEVVGAAKSVQIVPATDVERWRGAAQALVDLDSASRASAVEDMQLAASKFPASRTADALADAWQDAGSV